MFSNSIAELMIDKNDEMEKDVMPYSLSEPLLDSLQNVATRADHDKTRYSFSEPKKSRTKKGVKSLIGVNLLLPEQKNVNKY